MSDLPTDAGTHTRGRRLVGAALALIAAPTVVSMGFAARIGPGRVQALVIPVALVALLLVYCYRGASAARWALVALMLLGTARALVLALAPEAVGAAPGSFPGWLAPVQIAWCALVIALLQARDARAFLRAQRERLRASSRPAV